MKGIPLIRASGVLPFELGYSDPAHFTRAFRRWAAVTPLEYRERHLLERAGVRRSA